MMKVTHACAVFAALACIVLATPASATIIPAGWLVEHQWTLGDAEGGVIGATAADPAIDSVGGLNLPLTGAPTYAAGSNSAVAVDFGNAAGAFPFASTEFYSDPTADPTPADPSNWGLTFDVKMNSLPAAGLDQEVGLVHLGTFAAPGLIIELWQGNYVFHSPGNVFYDTGVAATVGGWDHFEMANLNGFIDLEINGVPLGSNILAGAYDPAAGVTIGSMYGASAYAEPYFRGADAVIDNVTLLSIPEPSSFLLASLCALAGLAVCKRRK